MEKTRYNSKKCYAEVLVSPMGHVANVKQRYSLFTDPHLFVLMAVVRNQLLATVDQSNYQLMTTYIFLLIV